MAKSLRCRRREEAESENMEEVRLLSWDTKEWTVLWDDLGELYEEENPRTHFIGIDCHDAHAVSAGGRRQVSPD